MLFVVVCLFCSGSELKRDVTVVLSKDSYVASYQVYINLTNYFKVVYIDKDFIITKPHSNGAIKERYYMILMQRPYYY